MIEKMIEIVCSPLFILVMALLGVLNYIRYRNKDKIKRMTNMLYFDLKYGKISSEVMDTIGHTPCEIKYRSESGEVIGYWSYGEFDTSYPYQGQFDLD